MNASRARLAALGAGLAVVAAIAAVPLLDAAGSPAGGAIRALFAPACHQIPERCLSLAGHPLAVCARCTGLYLGGLLGLAAACAVPVRPFRGRLVLLVAAALPTALDVGATLVLGAGLPAGLRPLPGLPLGAVAGLYLSAALADLAGGDRSDLRWTTALPTSSARP